jgi:hypothetical protein
MVFKAHYETVGPKEDIPVNEFMERLPPEIVLELCVFSISLSPLASLHPTRLLAADYQDGRLEHCHLILSANGLVRNSMTFPLIFILVLYMNPNRDPSPTVGEFEHSSQLKY